MKKIFWGLVGGILILVVVGLYLGNSKEANADGDLFSLDAYTGFDDIDDAVLFDMDRPSRIVDGKKYYYENIPSYVFDGLPVMPDDFYHRRVLFDHNILTDYCNLGEEYYLQPEWFPNFEGTWVKFLQSPNAKPKIGVSSFPEVSVIEIKKGGRGKSCFFVSNIPVSTFFAGVSLNYSFPDSSDVSSYLTNSVSVVQDPIYLGKNLRITMSPQEFVLDPIFKTKPAFSNKTVQKVEVLLDAEKLEVGNYMVEFRYVGNSVEKRDVWLNSYLTRYYDVAAKVSPARAVHKVLLMVRE